MTAVPAVLVVDADPEARKAAAAALPPDRYRVLYASSADAALHLLEGERVAVVVAEIALPGPSGLTVLARARREHPGVARVVLTAAADLDGAVQAINEAEVLRFLLKPADAGILRAAVDDALAWAEGAAGAAAARAAAERRHAEVDALVADHPGLIPLGAGADPDGYGIPSHRVSALAQRLAATPLGAVLDEAAKRER